MSLRSIFLSIAVALFAASVVAPGAGATTLVDGVSATRAGDRVTVTFTPAALTGAKLKAGKVIEADCSVVAPARELMLVEPDADDDFIYGEATVRADATA